MRRQRNSKDAFHAPCLSGIILILLVASGSGIAAQTGEASLPKTPAPRANARAGEAFVDRYCLDCHHSADSSGDLDLESLAKQNIEANADDWERVVRKLRSRQMPPPEETRPSEADYIAFLDEVEGQLDAAAIRNPQPGRTATFRRLTRLEYRNAIRDLLALEIDVRSLLPADAAGHGFDNVNVGDLSPTLLERYVRAAEQVSRLAVGRSQPAPTGDTFRVPGDRTQEQHVAGLPLGTRGGMLIPYTFPVNGEYEIQVRLTRDRDEHVEGLHQRHELEILIDRTSVGSLIINPPATEEDHQHADQHLNVRFQATAGPHDVGVTFLKKPFAVQETKRQPLNAHFNRHRHPRLSPAVFEVSITGAFGEISAGESPSRQRIFGTHPDPTTLNEDEQENLARKILAPLLRQAYRRPLTPADLEVPLRFYREGRQEEDFALGIERALSAVLVNPNFLLRIETDPLNTPPQSAYPISDVALASRLSFFIWSSLPDDELLSLAERGELSQAKILEQQVRRMLKDNRSQALVENFAGQWLYLRNLDSIKPNLRSFPDFDDNLRRSFRRETELLFESVLRQDQSVLQLLTNNHAFLDERLARHYGIPHVYGSRFRRVELDPEIPRGGLLRHGSILTVTSYATRTSPVIRGHWILDNVLGSPPPPPPPNVSTLDETVVSATLPIRQRLRAHREDTACAGCHRLMDPVGFALENFDAVGRWRELEVGQPIDSTGDLPDGSQFDGAGGLEKALLERPELFVGTLAEKLMTFALGRGIETSDAPAVRQIVRETRAADDRFSAMLVAIVQSPPFRMRSSE